MADVARADLAFSRVAAITVCVCLETGGDGLAGAGGLVTRGTTVRRAPFAAIVGGVVKLHIKALDELDGKSVHRRLGRLCVLVTNCTHNLITICELV